MKNFVFIVLPGLGQAEKIIKVNLIPKKELSTKIEETKKDPQVIAIAVIDNDDYDCYVYKAKDEDVKNDLLPSIYAEYKAKTGNTFVGKVIDARK